MKYICQLDYPHIPYRTRTDPNREDYEHGKTTTIASSGCGMCSAIMAADCLIPNLEFSLEEALALNYSVGANHASGTDYQLFAPAFAEKLGLNLIFSKDVQQLRQCLRTGGAAVVKVKSENGIGLFTCREHYMTIIGEEPDGRFAVLDPSFTPVKYEECYRKDKVEIKNDVIVLCSAEILKQEVHADIDHYYLFWRK